VSYTDPDTVRDRLAADGSDPSGSTAASMDDPALVEACNDAIAEVDGRIRGEPFADAEIPPLVATIATDIAAYLATLTHRKGNPLPDNHPVALRYRRAQDLLAKAAAGQLDITLTDTREVSEPQVQNPYDGALWDLPSLGIGADTMRRPWLG
jgi:phage gp36-like protein